MNDNQLKFRGNMPSSYIRNYEKAMLGKSRKEAIKAKCLDCAGWQREEIKNCPIDTCPLFYFRPYAPQKGGTISQTPQ